MKGVVSLPVLVALGASGCLPSATQAQNPQASRPAPGASALAAALKTAGLPARVGAWSAVRFVPGESGHYLYSHKTRTFSLFVTPATTASTTPPAPRPGWEPLELDKSHRALLHRDSRQPERSAVLWWEGKRRWMIVGKLSVAELTTLVRLLSGHG